MAISTVHKIDKVLSTTPSLDLSQITNFRVDGGAQILVDYPAGHVHPMYDATQEVRASASFTTTQIDTLLSAVTVAGGASASTDFYVKAGTSTGSTARASSAHRKLRITEGVIFWDRISLPHNGQATVDVTVVANYDGSNNPIILTTSQALSGNLTSTLHFGAGPFDINGTQIVGIQNVEISSGVQVAQEGGESELYPTFTFIQATAPTVTIQTREATNWGALADIDGLALNGTTGITFFARKYAADGGGRVTDVSAEHVKFVGSFGVVTPVDTSGDGNSLTTDTLLITLRANTDSTLPLVITTSQAIT